MLEDITYIFEKNFRRINNLLDLYEELEGVQSRASQKDILRSTVVFMHSTLEDFLRSILKWKLPGAPNDVLRNIPMAGTSPSGRKTKFELTDIIAYKGKTVDDVIELSINQYLSVISFNDTNDICNHLRSIGVNLENLEEYLSTLGKMIKRRHRIVHLSDRPDGLEIRKRKISYISKRAVRRYRDNLDAFALALTNELRE